MVFPRSIYSSFRIVHSCISSFSWQRMRQCTFENYDAVAYRVAKNTCNEFVSSSTTRTWHACCPMKICGVTNGHSCVCIQIEAVSAWMACAGNSCWGSCLDRLGDVDIGIVVGLKKPARTDLGGELEHYKDFDEDGGVCDISTDTEDVQLRLAVNMENL
jgi:hypothetical protein